MRKVKKAKWLYVVLALAMILAMVPAMAGAENGDEKCVTLYAGQNIPVGTVCVSNDGEYLYVTYCIDDEYWEDGEGWGLYETHVHVGEDLADFPLNRPGNPQIGHFAYKAYHEGVQCYEEVIPLGGWESGDELLIAAHAVVKRVICEEDVFTPELTWQRSSEEEVASFPGRGANWTSVDGFGIELDSDEVVWDGGTGDQNDLRAGVNAEISYATWIYDYADGESHDGLADLRRFQATFDVPEGFTITGGKLASVNDGYEDIVPINDNIYIFVNGTLQFWGGTIINVEGPTVFEGMDGAEAIRGGDVGDRDPAETDGWYIPGTFPEIDDGDFVVGENVLDVFAEEFSLWGAMHELGLTLEYEECIWENETAWGAGTRFVERGNWATYFGYTVVEDCIPELLETIHVYPNGNEHSSSVTLVEGREYEIISKGTYQWRSGAYPNGHGDAKYTYRSWEGSDQWVNSDLLNSHQTNPPGNLQLLVNGEAQDWGDFNPDHVYSIQLTGTGDPIAFDFKITDDYYRDNSGFLTVEIWGCPAP